MLANYIGVSVKVWYASTNPDNNVHTASGIYADIGEWFWNTSNNELLICTNNISGAQTWQSGTNVSLIQSIIGSSVLQSDWSQSSISSQDYIKNKPSLATVATSGSYNDLSNKPTIPAAQVQSDWTQATIGAVDYIKNKPSLAAVATSGAYSDLTGKPTLATVAISGSYTDLINKPTIPSAQVQSDWTQATISSVDYIKNKPNFATVATSGSYNDLSNKPTIPAAQIQSDWTQANTGLLEYIKNKPTIPAAQIQSDWTQSNTSALDYIKNKPAARSQSAASRSLNTIFQVSATRWSVVRYCIDISTTVSLSGSQIGQVILEMATNATFTTGVQTLQQFINGNSGTLVVGLVLTQLATACLSGDIPPGNYVRLRTVNLTGSPTFTYQNGQETLI